MKLSPGERLLIKRALQVYARSLLDTKLKTPDPQTRNELDATIAGCDALGDRMRKERDDNAS